MGNLDILGKVRYHAKALARRGAPQQRAASATLTRLLEPIGPLDPSKPAGPRIVLIDDCRDQINFGACVLIDGLVDILLKGVPNSVLVPVPSHWLLDVSSGFGAFLDGGAGLWQPEATFPGLADQFENVADEWMSGRAGADAQLFLERFEGADLVVLNGEGSIYRTNQSAIRELFLAWLAKERLGIPTVFINGTVHLTDVVPLLPAMVRKTFRVLDAVAVREQVSLRNVQQYVPDVQTHLFPDSAFVFSADTALETPAVAAIRAQVGSSSYFCFDPGAMHMDHRLPKESALFDLITRLKQVVPQAVLVNSSPADIYIKKIAIETGSVYVDTISDYREFMSLVQGAEFVVTGRYHNPILAAMVGTPSITFASANHKVHGACEMLDGVIGTPYDGTYLRPQLDEIEQRARTLVAERDDYRTRLLEVSAQRRAEAMSLGDFVAATLQASSG